MKKRAFRVISPISGKVITLNCEIPDNIRIEKGFILSRFLFQIGRFLGLLMGSIFEITADVFYDINWKIVFSVLFFCLSCLIVCIPLSLIYIKWIWPWLDTKTMASVAGWVTYFGLCVAWIMITWFEFCTQCLLGIRMDIKKTGISFVLFWLGAIIPAKAAYWLVLSMPWYLAVIFSGFTAFVVFIFLSEFYINNDKRMVIVFGCILIGILVIFQLSYGWFPSGHPLLHLREIR